MMRPKYEVRKVGNEPPWERWLATFRVREDAEGFVNTSPATKTALQNCVTALLCGTSAGRMIAYQAREALGTREGLEIVEAWDDA